MKKILLSFIAFLSFGSAFSQTNVYHPFPDSSSVWSVNIMKYIIKGDSVYNSKTYKKYYSTSDTNLTVSSLQYFGMVRQDIVAKRVFGIGPSETIERLIYDFALNVNDTVSVYPIEWCASNFPYKQKIIGKDSILINGSYRQRVFLEGYYNSNARDTVIEGIGSYCGPLAIGLNPFCVTDVCSPILLCQKQDGILMYQNPVYNKCYYDPCPLNVKTQSHNNSVEIYPNPTGSIMNIKSEKNIEWKKIALLNIFGEEVSIKQVSSPEIDVSALPNGIYFLKITDGERSFSKKVVIQH